MPDCNHTYNHLCLSCGALIDAPELEEEDTLDNTEYLDPDWYEVQMELERQK